MNVGQRIALVRTEVGASVYSFRRVNNFSSYFDHLYSPKW